MNETLIKARGKEITMSYRKNLFQFLIILALVGSFLWFSSCRPHSHEEDGSAKHSEECDSESVVLSEEALKLAGIRVEELKEISLQPELKAPGEVVINPRKFYRLTSRVSGRVEELLVYEGDKVRAGQVVARLFSLNYLESLTELKLAKERLDRLNQEQSGEITLARELFISAKTKLRILGLSDRQIDSLLKSASPEIHLYEVLAPVDGQVLNQKVFRGDTLEVGAEIAEIASFDPVWVEGRVQEKEAGLVYPGQTAVVRTRAYPEFRFSGIVTYISPVLDSTTRTLKIRIEARNSEGRLKPGLFVEVGLFLPEKTILAVPEEAVQEINGQTVVFVTEKQGVFLPRPVKLGEPISGFRPVLSGLEEGEKYAVTGAFMLKAELLKHLLGEEGHRHD